MVIPKSQSGIYFLIIRIPHTTQITIGKLRTIDFKRGYYIYDGSAMGSGGLRARVERHLSDRKKIHWHIDYLLMARGMRGEGKGKGNESGRGERAAVVRKVFVLPTCEREECKAANHLGEKLAVVPKLGSSDCRCSGHLYFSRRKNDVIEAIHSYSPGIISWDEFSKFADEDHSTL